MSGQLLLNILENRRTGGCERSDRDTLKAATCGRHILPQMRLEGLATERLSLLLSKPFLQRPLREPVLKALGRFSVPETLKNIVPLLEESSKTIQEGAGRTIKNFYHNGVKKTLLPKK